MKKYIYIGLIFLIIFFGIKSSFFNIKDIDINIDNVAKVERIFNVVKKYNWFFSDVHKIENEIKKIPYVKYAKVKKKFFLKLIIDIQITEPFVSIKTGDIYVIIDRYQKVLDISHDSYAPYEISGFRILSSKIGNKIVCEDSDLIDNAVKIVYLFQEYNKVLNDVNLVPKISLVNGNIIHTINDEFIINFGLAKNPDHKFKAAISMYEYMKDKNITSGVINLSYENQNLYEPWKN